MKRFEVHQYEAQTNLTASGISLQLATELKRQLRVEHVTYREWLVARIAEYLARAREAA